MGAIIYRLDFQAYFPRRMKTLKLLYNLNYKVLEKLYASWEHLYIYFNPCHLKFSKFFIYNISGTVTIIQH